MEYTEENLTTFWKASSRPTSISGRCPNPRESLWWASKSPSKVVRPKQLCCDFNAEKAEDTEDAEGKINVKKQRTQKTRKGYNLSGFCVLCVFHE